MDFNYYLITLSDTSNQNANETLLRNIKELGSELKSKLEGGILIFSPKLECIESAKALDREVTFSKFELIENFFDSETIPKSEFLTNYDITPMCVGDVSLNESAKYFFSFLESHDKEGSCLILLLDENWFEKLRPYCKSIRNYGLANFCSLENYRPELEYDNSGYINDIQKTLPINFRSYNFGRRIGTLENSLNFLSSNQGRVQMISDSIEHTQASNVSIHEIITSFEVDAIKKSLDSIKENLKENENILKSYEDIANTYADVNTNLELHEIQISRFFYDENEEKWRLRLINDTKLNFFNVDIVIVETQVPICNFNIIQSECTVWKTLDLEYTEDYYGVHLVALSQNIIITPSFYVAPFKLQAVANQENNTIEFTLINYSRSKIDNILLALSNKYTPELFENINSEYKGKTHLTLNFEELKSFYAFAFYENKKISNELEIVFNNQSEDHR
jgi:hypothetical protein